MSAERCERTELLVDQCAHCRGNDQTVQEQADAERAELRKRLARDPRWFPSQYAGRCICDKPFGVGTLIRRCTCCTDSWVAECCAGPP